MVEKFPTTKAAVSTQNTTARTASCSVTPVADDVAARVVARGADAFGACLSTKAWMGIVSTARTTASTSRVDRQSIRPSSHDVIGMKIVLASPAVKVTVRS